MGYFVLKLHKYILGTPETNITSSKKGHNRCPLNAAELFIISSTDVNKLNLVVKCYIYISAFSAFLYFAID